MIDSELLRVFVLSPAELDPWDYHRSQVSSMVPALAAKWYGMVYVLSSTFTCLVGCCEGRSRQKFASSLFPSNKPEL